MSTEYINPIVHWPANDTLGLPELELEIPVKTSGRVEIYKVPVCDSYPEGYFVALNTNTSWYANVEPGCASWEKTLLARLLISDPTLEDENSSSTGKNIVEYIHPALEGTLDMLKFNPEQPVKE